MSSAATRMPGPAASPGFSFHIEGQIPVRPTPPAYKITLALTAFAMVLLPLGYVALIGVAVYGLKYYKEHGAAGFDGSSSGISMFLLYFAPIIVGAIMIVFMIKPLFARPARRKGGYVLDLEREPRLRDTIAAICRHVGSPMPTEIKVDCQPNASAGLRRGIFSLGRKDLVLTIGLPLASQLTARQLAGVLAHEFGHFRQGAGMAFSYIINSINHWFARVVFERDSWDEGLADLARNMDIRLGLILRAAQLAVWISRKILFFFMYVGRIITCLQLRQMEYDADYYEIWLAGSAAFTETARELRRLGTANQLAFGELGGMWNSRQLVDNFPSYVALRRARLDADTLGKIDGAAGAAKTGWFDTHPSDTDRDRHAHSLRQPGIVQGDGPASALFLDFEALSREATQHFYRTQLGLSFEPASLVATSEAARSSEEATAADEARSKVLGDVAHPLRPVLWSHADFATPLTEAAPEISAQLEALKQKIADLRPAAESHNATYGNLRGELNRAILAYSFHSAKISINDNAFGSALNSTEKANSRRTALREQLRAECEALTPIDAAFHDWVGLVGRCARSPAFAASLPSALPARIVATTDALAHLEPWFRALPEWAEDQALLAVLSQSEGNFDDMDVNFPRLLAVRRDKARNVVLNAPGLISAVPWPFHGPSAPQTVNEHLDRSLGGVLGDERVLVLVRTAADLYLRLLSQAARLGLELEQALATTPVRTS